MSIKNCLDKNFQSDSLAWEDYWSRLSSTSSLSIPFSVLPQFCLGRHHFVIHFVGKIVIESHDCSVVSAYLYIVTDFLVAFLLITSVFSLLFYFG